MTLALTLKHLSLGTTHAIWSGVGTVVIVIAGVVVIHLGGGVTR